MHLQTCFPQKSHLWICSVHVSVKTFFVFATIICIETAECPSPSEWCGIVLVDHTFAMEIAINERKPHEMMMALQSLLRKTK